MGTANPVFAFGKKILSSCSISTLSIPPVRRAGQFETPAQHTEQETILEYE